VPNIITESEAWFDAYLAEQGYTVHVEPDLGVPTRPDRLIVRAGAEAICELKEFTTDAFRRRFPEGGSGPGVFGPKEWLLTVRRTISSAARQLEPLAGDGRPLVILLANPKGMGVPLDPDELIEAMYGDLTITCDVSRETGAAVSEPVWTVGANGRLAGGKAPWVSAVGRIRRHDREAEWRQQWIADWKKERGVGTAASEEEATRTFVECMAEYRRVEETEEIPLGIYFTIDLIETTSDDAGPLTADLFDREGDRRWALDAEAGAFVQVR
jgi:hypothetical protein